MGVRRVGVTVRLPVSDVELGRALLDVIGALTTANDVLHDWVRDTLHELLSRLRAGETVNASELVEGDGWSPRASTTVRADTTPTQLAGVALLVRLAREFRLGSTEAALAAILHDPEWREHVARVLRPHRLTPEAELPGDEPAYLHDRPDVLLNRARELARDLECPRTRELLRRWERGDPDAYPELLRTLAEYSDVLADEPYQPLLEWLAERYGVEEEVLDNFARLIHPHDLPPVLRWEHRVLRANAAALPGPLARRGYLPWVHEEHETAYTDLRRLVPLYPETFDTVMDARGYGLTYDEVEEQPTDYFPEPVARALTADLRPDEVKAGRSWRHLVHHEIEHVVPVATAEPLTTLTQEELCELRETLPHPDPALARVLPLAGIIRIKSWLLHRKLPGRDDVRELSPVGPGS